MGLWAGRAVRGGGRAALGLRGPVALEGQWGFPGGGASDYRPTGCRRQL